MIDWEKIKDITPDEVIIINELQKLAAEAKEAAKLIRATYRCFGIGEEKITVWKDYHNTEYLTYTGVWQARYLHQTYDVECSAEGIFEYFKAEFLADYFKDEGVEDYEIAEKASICKYFRKFLRDTQEKSKPSVNTGITFQEE